MEEELIKNAQNGESEAFGKLYDVYLSRIFRFVFIKVSSRPDAEDLTHQIFLNAWQNIKNFEFRGFPFSSWLYKIASNAVIDHYRTKKNYLSIEFIAEDALADFPDLAEKLDEAIDMKVIVFALRKLEPDQQNVLIMTFIDDLPNKEIAKILDKSEGAIRVVQHRALKQLKKYVDESKSHSTT